MPEQSIQERREELKAELNLHRENATQRRINREMPLPAPNGLEGQTMTPEQIEADEAIIEERETQILQELKDLGLEVSLDEKNVTVDEFNKNAIPSEELTKDVNQEKSVDNQKKSQNEDSKSPSIPANDNKIQEGQDYFNPDDFDFSSTGNEKHESLSEEFNEISIDPPTAGQGIEP